MDLKRQLGVSYNTAWLLKHKLMQTMRERDDSQPLRGIVEVDDAYLGGETSGGKRGRGAERKTPFVAAAQVSADGRPERLRLSPVAGFRKRALQAWATQHLQAGTLVRSDGLGLFPRRAGGCLHAPSAGHRRRQGQLRDARVELGEHPARQRQACNRRNLSCLRGALCGALSGRVRLPFQSAL